MNTNDPNAATVAATVQFAGPLRRFGAIVYDTLLVIAVLIVATVPFLPLLHGRVMAPKEVGALAYLYWCWELVVVAMFFVIFWTRRGQSLGMQVWRLRIETLNGALPTTSQVLQRLVSACVPWLPAILMLAVAERSQMRTTLTRLGVSLFALVLVNYCNAWFDAKHRAWHDRFLSTRIVYKPL